MITCIREVRKAKGLTLQDVAERCVPPTTAQTIGRLETGTRTVSVGWLRRIAHALGVNSADLVQMPDRADLPVAAVLGPDGAHAPRRAATVVPPRPESGQVAVTVQGSVGDYRGGDAIWCDRIAPDAFGEAIHCDVLAPGLAGRFVFGRLIAWQDGRATIMPPGAGGRTRTVDHPDWIAIARKLVRDLGSGGR